jgi:hypothetical protein
LKKLSVLDWKSVAKGISDAVHLVPGRRREIIEVKDLPNKLNVRTALVFGTRFKTKDKNAIFLKYLSKYQNHDATTAIFCFNAAMSLLDSKPEIWNFVLKLLQHNEAGSIIGNPYHVFTGMRRVSQDMPLTIARKIASKPNTYPQAWVYIATERCELDEASKVEAVGVTAKREGWFKA